VHLRMIRADLGLEQLLAPDQPLGELLAHRGLGLVGQPRRHRSAGDQHHRQMPEAQRAHQQARHDLVADAEQRRALERAVREGDGGAQRNRVAAEQRQLHPRIALRHAVAHCRHAARDLRGRAGLTRPDLHQFRIAVVDGVCRQHVVIRGDDADVHAGIGLHRVAVFLGPGIGVREVRAAEARTPDLRRRLALDQRYVGGTAVARPLDDPVGNRGDDGVQHRHGAQCTSIGSSTSASTRPIG
jgi:hypothetical protein